ncbi:protein phosphatase 2C domain-containing protein [bacterium]|nr:protein phosphatase 2C domain-containing protein [bacterium]
MYEFICARTQGADHIKHGIPCQDYGSCRESELCKIFAVADGHGDSNCPRSNIGSKKACEIALAKMETFCAGINDNGLEAELLSEGKRRELRVRQLISSIMAEWEKAVSADIEASPLTKEERAGCGKYLEKYDRGERLEHIYGTTLIAGLLTERYLLLLQQGDGRCVVFNQDGSACQPVPWDDKCFANITTSLCDTDAVQRFRYSVIDLKKNPVAACLAASDGVEDSFFSMDLMYSYCRDLLIYAQQNGVKALNKHLDETLPEFSRTGSGDDVTVCGVVDIGKIADFAGVFERDNEIIRQESVIRDAEARLKSMNGMGKMDALKKKYEQAERDFDAAKQIQEKADEILQAFVSESSQFDSEETKSPDNWEKFRKLFSSLGIGLSIEEIIEKRRSALEKAKDEADRRAEQITAKYLAVKQECETFMSKRAEYEQRKAEAEKRIGELKNTSLRENEPDAHTGGADEADLSASSSSKTVSAAAEPAPLSGESAADEASSEGGGAAEPAAE